MNRREMDDLVATLTDEERVELIGACHSSGILVPNWYHRELVAEMVGEDIAQDEWDEFREWFDDSGIPDDISRDLRSWWSEHKEYVEDDEN